MLTVRKMNNMPVKEFEKNLSKDMDYKFKLFWGISALVVLAAAFSLTSIDIPFAESDKTNKSDKEVNLSDYASANESTVHEISDTSSNVSETFQITDNGIKPASHRVGIGDMVGFKNSRNGSVKVTFDRSDTVLNLQTGEQQNFAVNGITYFEVEGEDFTSTGRINVQ